MIFEYNSTSVSPCTYFFIYFDSNNDLIGSDYITLDMDVNKKMIVPNKLSTMYILSSIDINDINSFVMLNICSIPVSLNYAKIYLVPNRVSLTSASVILVQNANNFVLSFYENISTYISKSTTLCSNMINFKQQDISNNYIGICFDLPAIETYVESFNTNSNNQSTSTTSISWAFIIFIIIIVLLLMITIGFFVYSVHAFYSK